MKTPCLLACCLALITMNALSAEPLATAQKLAADGNHREAANTFKAILQEKAAPADTLAQALDGAATSLQHLNEQNELELLTEETIKTHADHWQVLASAAKVFSEFLQHSGAFVDNTFKRAAPYNAGRYADCQLRDKVRSLQLIFAARAKMPANTEPKKKAELIYLIIKALGTEAESDPWKLQALTDLTHLPDYGDQDEHGSRQGWPVDASNEPIYFRVPTSYATATNDGERLRFALGELGSLSPANNLAVRALWAGMLKQWFSVRTLQEVIGHQSPDLEKQKRDGIATLHTLGDDETSMMLATGPRRFKLPPDAQFVRILRELVSSKLDQTQLILPEEFDAEDLLTTTLDELVEELLDRHQFEEAATELKAAIARTDNPDRKKALNERLDQIEGKWGQFLPAEPQAAGSKAKLTLLFRNSFKAEFSARRVDIAKLIKDSIAYLKTSPSGHDDKRPATIENIASDLLRDVGEEYLSDPVEKWMEDLTPLPKHWDTQLILTTPLDTAGTYLIEANVGGKSPVRALLTIEGLTIVETKQADGIHYFVADALTGAPIQKAKLAFFGFNTEWKSDGVLTKTQSLHYSFGQFDRSADKAGVSKVSSSALKDKRWLITATDDAGRLAYSGFENHWFSDRDSELKRQSRIYIVTDRPVYRPGQEVKWKLWARTVGYDSKSKTNVFAGDKCHVIISNQRSEKLLEKDYKFDESGAVEDLLKLDDEATLGSCNISVRINKDGPTGYQPFRIEEYKKPEFEVKVQAPDKPVALGEAFDFTVKADYYFGGPVKQGKVKYTVQRHSHHERWWPGARWDWLFGEGYSWRSLSYGWYPGNAASCIIAPHYPWMNWGYNPPELVAQGELPIGADGTVKVKIDTALAKELHGDQDHRYEIQVEATDSSRRTINGSGKVLATRRPFEVYVWLDRGWYQTRDAAQANLQARTLDGREVKTTGEWILSSITYDAKGEPKEVVELRRGSSEQPLTIKWPHPGQYRLTAKLKDEAGHEVEASTFVVVRGEAFDGKDFRFDDLELITQKDEYQPGDEVELLINTNRPASTVALFVRGTNHDPVWLHLDGKSISYRFKLTEADQPNIFVEAYTVSDAKLHHLTRQIIVPPTKRIATVELTTDKPTYLPRDDAKTTIRVKDQNGQPFIGDVILTGYDKALEYISGGANIGDIRPFFWGWKRSRSADIGASFKPLVTELMKDGEIMMSSLGIGNQVEWHSSSANTHTMRDMLNPFQVRTSGITSSGGYGGFGRSAKAVAAPSPPPAASGRLALAESPGSYAAAPSPASPPPALDQAPMLRTNLADSAVWITHVKTNAAGEASLDFPMPDNLTTWKLRSWVMGSETQVGEAAVEVITRKDLMVRLQAPRFFTEGDEVTISVNVHNESDKLLQIIPGLSGKGAKVAQLGSGSDGTPVPLEAHSESRFDWRLRIEEPGEIRLNASAVSEDVGDAMEMTFPIYEHGTLKTDSWSLALRGDEPRRELSFDVPGLRKPESTRLEVRWSPTLAMAMIDALPYLADYPYGCTEQTLNRFVPTVITLNVLKDMGIDLKQVRDKRVNLNAQEIGDAKKRAEQAGAAATPRRSTGLGTPRPQPVFDENEVKKMARAGLTKLKSMQAQDGGWGWFPGGRESSAHMTALVVHGLITARSEGDADLIERGKQWLVRYEATELAHLKLPEKDIHHKSAPDDTDALVHSVLTEASAGTKEMRDALYEKRNDLSRNSVALLGLACDASKESEHRDMCLRNLQQFVKQDEATQTAWLDLPATGWWHWWNDRIETQAMFLKLLCKTDPKGDLASRIAKYLLNNRRNGSYWNSTRDTAAVIEALAVFIKASGEAKPDMKLDVVLDSKVLKTITINKDNLFSFDNSLVLEGEEVKTGRHFLELRREGTGPVYSSTYLTLFSKEEMIPAAGLDVKVNRKFYKLTEQKTDVMVSGGRGQVLHQQGLKYARTELATGDALKSGDLVEVELIIESNNDYEYLLIADPKPAGFEPVEVRSGWSYEGLAAYQEYRDEKVAFFVQHLPQGTSTVSYRVKAEIPGDFSALPSKVDAMYAPEIRANAAEWRANISDPE